MSPSSPGFTYSYELGRVGQTIFHVGARLDPDPNDVQDFAIMLFFELPTGEIVKVAMVDNTAHQGEGIHVHRYYREEGITVRDFDVALSDWMEAEEYLRRNAERMVRAYLDTHGRAARSDR